MPKKNRLAEETSPYLLQHAENPVDWYPWGSEALEKSRREEKPILLSIGYSSCHWCHVMEHESFEDTQIAAAMNESFVNIKVDREERPDLDSIYMNYVQMTTGQGGWPLTVFLTPELVPFFGGTYFPPSSRHGRPGFPEVLDRVANFYAENREEIEQKAPQIKQSLERTLPADEREVDESILNQVFQSLIRQIDQRHGGFGGAPKFPSSMALSFLLRCHKRTGQQSALEGVELSLTKMAKGGIYDQLGGGFHRYAVDERWLVPHFEKMLYDNALLVSTYLEAFQITGKELYRETVEETLDYILRDMASGAGGFYSAEDADSEGVEGKFYVWDQEEIETLLSSEEAEFVKSFFGVSRFGNWEGKNILTREVTLREFASRTDRDLEECREVLSSVREKLLQAREERVRPGLDDKVLASWNGLMLRALAEAGFILENSTYLDAARRNADFLLREMVAEGRLRRTWKEGNAKLHGYLDDYAHVAEGLLSLFEVTGEGRWLTAAKELTDRQFELFYDEDAGDFYFTAHDQEELLVRPKEHFDNATPSGNSTAAVNLLRLYRWTGEEDYLKKADRLISVVREPMEQYPTAFGNWLRALDLSLGPVREVVVVGDSKGRKPLLEILRKRYLPNQVMLLGEKEAYPDDHAIPLLRGRRARKGQATAYVCRDFSCRRPTSDPEELARQLQEA